MKKIALQKSNTGIAYCRNPGQKWISKQRTNKHIIEKRGEIIRILKEWSLLLCVFLKEDNYIFCVYKNVHYACKKYKKAKKIRQIISNPSQIFGFRSMFMILFACPFTFVFHSRPKYTVHALKLKNKCLS